ncbi:hypothetical protein ABIB68_003698 [Bradyrhizobium sp. F1.2.2]
MQAASCFQKLVQLAGKIDWDCQFYIHIARIQPSFAILAEFFHNLLAAQRHRSATETPACAPLISR